MAFSVVDRQPGGCSGTISTGYAGEAHEVWIVIADNYDYTTEDVRSSGIFPAVYESFHAQNSRLRLMPIDIEQDDDNPSLFRCGLTWSSDTLDPKEKEEKDNSPLDRVARIKVKTAKLRECKHRDFYGKPKMNAAGELFDPPIESNSSFKIINIRKNVTVFPDWVWDYDDAVNTVPFTIKGRTINKGCAWIADIELDEENTDGAVPYCEARIEMHIRKRRKPFVGARTTEALADVPDPWDTEQLNEGLHQRVAVTPATVPATYKRVKIYTVDDTGVLVAVASPVPLADDGTLLTADKIRKEEFSYLVFQDHEKLDFNAISYLWSNA